MNKSLWLWFVAAATACSPAVRPLSSPAVSEQRVTEAAPVQTTAPRTEVNLKNYGPAPELTNETWLNTDQPLRLADLRGQVVLLDFWTFG